MSPTYQLVDGPALAEAHPDKFHLPSAAAIHLLKPGDHAQVMLASASEDEVPEMLWVLIEGIRAVGALVGTLANTPQIPGVASGISYGDEVLLERRHILACLYTDENEPHGAIIEVPAS